MWLCDFTGCEPISFMQSRELALAFCGPVYKNPKAHFACGNCLPRRTLKHKGNERCLFPWRECSDNTGIRLLNNTSQHFRCNSSQTKLIYIFELINSKQDLKLLTQYSEFLLKTGGVNICNNLYNAGVVLCFAYHHTRSMVDAKPLFLRSSMKHQD